MRLTIAGGGTGGHIYPALAVARTLRARPDAPELRWLGGHRGFEREIVAAAGIPLDRLALRSRRTTDLSIHAVLDPLRLLVAVPQALAILVRHRPAAILATGGYVAIPTLAAAAVLRIPTLLWDGNVIPGRSTRLVARLAAALAVSFDATCEALGRGRPCYVTGTPIRDLDAIDRTASRERLGIAPGERVLLVFGGSQAVRRLNDAVLDALPTLVGRVTVIHVAGADGLPAATEARAALPEAGRVRYRPFAFLGEEMTDALAAADLVVGRAGSSTLAETAAFGLPMIVVPYPHAAGHQRANARAAVDAGAARLVADEAFDAAALLDAARILDDPAEHVRMAAGARELARPGAAAAVADLLLAIAERRPLPGSEAIERASRRLA
jgi:UDP-N-acetylglucosamine--N-acetylmuramyl-(pentapeptide) pyrophosphoryl-undecaprenol N-acetylglucosamine transferase